MSDPPTPEAGKPDGASAIPPAPGGRLAVEAGKLLGTSLEALVRSIRSESHGLAAVAERAAGLWRDHAAVTLAIRPTALMVGERVGFQADAHEGRWILSTFMSGLREIQATSQLTADDMLQLAHELAALEPTPEAITRFQDWLWCDGAEGFRVELAPSFVEIIEEVAAQGEPRRDQEVAAVRGESVAVLGVDGVEIAASDLDEAALRPELQVPLDLYAQGFEASGGPDLSQVDRATLGERCEDPTGWLIAQLTATLVHPRLRRSVPAGRLARRIGALTAGRVGPGLLALLTRLAGEQSAQAGDDPYLDELFRHLEGQGLGTRLARGLSFAAAGSVQTVRAFLSTVPSGVRRDFLHGLLARAGDEPPVFSAVVELLTGGEAAALTRSLDLPALAEADALVLIRALKQLRAPSRQVVRLLDSVSDRTAAALVGEMPGDDASQEPLLRRLLESNDPAALEAITGTLLAGGSARGRRLLAEALRRRRGAGWRRDTLRRLAGTLLAGDGGSKLLVELARSRTATPEARLAALEGLAARPALLATAAAWRPAELLDPPEVRDGLRRARQRAREGG